jgi:hypothetical protein
MTQVEWVKTVIADLEFGLFEFGDYAFRDKGPNAVMNVDAQRLLKMDPCEAGKWLQALHAHPHRHAKRVAQAILGQCDESSEAWWEACCENCPDVEY